MLVFFFHFFCEKCSKMKNENNGGKGAQKNIFKNVFQNEATVAKENKKANTWQACYSRHHRCARVLSISFARSAQNEKNQKKLCARSTPTLTPGIAHVAPWPRGRVVGVCPSAWPPFHLSFSLTSRPCPRLPPGGAPRWRCDTWTRHE